MAWVWRAGWTAVARRGLWTSPARARLLRRSDLFRAALPVDQGLLGAVSELPVELRADAIERVMPTPETSARLFNGVRYDQLPVAHIRCTRNNTLVTFTDHHGTPLTGTSSGMEGFKNARKKTQIAGQATGVGAGLRALRRGITTVRVRLRGLGPGRDTAVRGMALAGVQVVSISEVTHLKELGPRPKKPRRI